MEYTEDDVWDAGVSSCPGGGTRHHPSVMNNAQRVLGACAHQVAEAWEPGSSGDPFDGLTSKQREALADLYAAGFTRGAERSIAWNLNAALLGWSWAANRLVLRHRDYFEAFWSEPGHAGGDGELDEAVVNVRATVAAALTPDEASSYPLSSAWGRMSLSGTSSPEKQVGLLLAGDLRGPAEGSRITIRSGQAAGRELYCLASSGRLLLGSAVGEPQALLFDGVEAGDEVHIDNRDYLAYCFYYRHHLPATEQMGRLTVDGRPLYPQYDFDQTGASPGLFGGGFPMTGAIRRPMFMVQNMFDTSCWPIGAVLYGDAVRAQLSDAAEHSWRLWLIDNAEHVAPWMITVPDPPPVPSTRLIDPFGVVEAALDAMVSWIEDGITPPASTSYTLNRWDNRVELAATARERCGIQPTVTATANGSALAEVKAGEDVVLAVEAEVPPNGGAITEIGWDFDGSGNWPEVHRQSSPRESVRHETRYRFEAPGTYFPAARVLSHLKGLSNDPHAQIMNLGRCRVVVCA